MYSTNSKSTLKLTSLQQKRKIKTITNHQSGPIGDHSATIQLTSGLFFVYLSFLTNHSQLAALGKHDQVQALFDSYTKLHFYDMNGEDFTRQQQFETSASQNYILF